MQLIARAYVKEFFVFSPILSQNFKKKSPKVSRAPRRLITISTSGARWNGTWGCDYVFTLAELQLADLAEDGQKDAEVFISLSIQKVISHSLSIQKVSSLHSYFR